VCVCVCVCGVCVCVVCVFVCVWCVFVCVKLSVPSEPQREACARFRMLRHRKRKMLLHVQPKRREVVLIKNQLVHP